MNKRNIKSWWLEQFIRRWCSVIYFFSADFYMTRRNEGGVVVKLGKSSSQHKLVILLLTQLYFSSRYKTIFIDLETMQQIDWNLWIDLVSIWPEVIQSLSCQYIGDSSSVWLAPLSHVNVDIKVSPIGLFDNFIILDLLCSRSDSQMRWDYERLIRFSRPRCSNFKEF